ncbi:protein phosphatase 2C domain-containing protein [Cardiosporidium cionae]|uniref:Protein phosphatase 2C domain-containing protein n=1 Tax=Cardiosporidium cionae TaxID=476202 RepID=A0ABQ7JEW2_9APIC|nr:protein phosphatase 2C domain-containing protein [Cardiosporidium cionae]|eukprot:KAF8822534.1 protein phosphatase 2C domain-containing protein [Cardiosporidium cionae]
MHVSQKKKTISLFPYCLVGNIFDHNLHAKKAISVQLSLAAPMRLKFFFRGQTRWLYAVATTAVVGSSAAFWYWKQFSLKPANILVNKNDVPSFLSKDAVNGSTVDGIKYFYSSFGATFLNEDAFAVDTDKNLVALIDGHTNVFCSQWLQENVSEIVQLSLTESLKKFVSIKNDLPSIALDQPSHSFPDIQNGKLVLPLFNYPLAARNAHQYVHRVWGDALSSAFVNLDRLYYASCNTNEKGISVKPTHKNQHLWTSGASACCVVAAPFGILISNIGETAAVCGVRHALNTIQPLKASQTHTLSNPLELKRLKNVHMAKSKEYSLQPSFSKLRVTRSIGDYHLKDLRLNYALVDGNPLKMDVPVDTPSFVSSLPDSLFLPYSQNIDFIIIGSSGFWKLVKSDEAVRDTAAFLEEMFSSERDANDSGKDRNETNFDVLVRQKQLERCISQLKLAIVWCVVAQKYEENPAHFLLRQALVNFELQQPSPRFFINQQFLDNSGLAHHNSYPEETILQKAALGDFGSQKHVLKKVINRQITKFGAQDDHSFGSVLKDDVSVAVIVLPRNIMASPPKNRFSGEYAELEKS